VAPAPPLEQVLGNVVPGRGQRLRLTEAQRRALDDRDGRIARQVIRALARARTATGRPSGPFPLTEAAFQAVARRLGLSIGDKRTRAIIKRCIALGVLESAGSYPAVLPERGRPVRLSSPPLPARGYRRR
jgi:hypothetical protein